MQRAIYFGLVVHIVMSMTHKTLVEKNGVYVIVDTVDLRFVRAASN